MDINKKADGANLEIALKGRLDTTTAPELEKALELDGVANLILDFADLEYISSAGLRVILAAQKKMSAQGSMILKNVNDTIKEVFEITGFIDILTIE